MVFPSFKYDFTYKVFKTILSLPGFHVFLMQLLCKKNIQNYPINWVSDCLKKKKKLILFSINLGVWCMNNFTPLHCQRIKWNQIL